MSSLAYDYPTSPCPVCGVEHEGMYVQIGALSCAVRAGVRPGEPALQLCGKCAAIIANAFNLRHGGRPLTWDDNPKLRNVREIVPEEMRWKVFERDGFACKHCGSQSMLRADHILAQSKEGPSTFDNLQTLCRSCNSRKGDR